MRYIARRGGNTVPPPPLASHRKRSQIRPGRAVASCQTGRRAGVPSRKDHRSTTAQGLSRVPSLEPTQPEHPPPPLTPAGDQPRSNIRTCRSFAVSAVKARPVRPGRGSMTVRFSRSTLLFRGRLRQQHNVTTGRGRMRYDGLSHTEKSKAEEIQVGSMQSSLHPAPVTHHSSPRTRELGAPDKCPPRTVPMTLLTIVNLASLSLCVSVCVFTNPRVPALPPRARCPVASCL